MLLSMSWVSVMPGMEALPPLLVDTSTGTSYLTSDDAVGPAAMSGVAMLEQRRGLCPANVPDNRRSPGM